MLVLDEVSRPEKDVITAVRQDDHVRKVGKGDHDPLVTPPFGSPHPKLIRRTLDQRAGPSDAFAAAKVRQPIRVVRPTLRRLDVPAGRRRRSTAGISTALRVGAPYLVDRDGTIDKTFDDTAWIYHLGIKGTNGRYDKASVAIEFANELGLALDGERLYAFGMNTPNTVYTGPFFAFDWRDYSYFAQLDEAQVDAGIELTLDICRRHDIEPSFYYPSTTFDFPRCFQVATIVCHSNCRRDKTDLALPDWVYERVEGAGIRLVL